MRQHPDGRELLVSARKVLREKILSSLHSSQRHDLLMAINAMSITERELLLDHESERVERASLSSLLDADIDDLASANRRLSEQLRRGAADPGQSQRASYFAHLRAVARARLAVSNPKALGPGD